MKKVLFFIACLFTTGILMAQKVSVEEAKDAARLYLGEKLTRSGAKDLALAYTQMSVNGSNAEDVYVFNNGSDGGYVVVAGDLRAGELILGYSYSGCFDYDTTSETLKWWLTEYAREIDYMRENMDEVKTTRSKVGVKASESTILVKPLLGDLKWHQDKPFNTLCKSPNGETAVVGCVATAMSMIMYYYKWPLHGTGSHTNSRNSSQYVNFAESVYDWNNMLENYSNTYSAVQAQAVAKLAYDCGVSVDMNYTKSSSGAYSSDVPNALKKYFSYDEDLKLILRNSQENWDQIIKDELLAKRPVYYSGQSDEGGHAFVCDGCEIRNDIDYFHFNFGWGGEGNGYFRTHMIDFNKSQDIVIGIKPANKVKVDGLYYNIANDTVAYVSVPETASEYTGKIVIPASISNAGKTYKVTKISSYAFANNSGITEITIPNTVVYIGDEAFSACSGLKAINVGWTDEMPWVENTAFGSDVMSNTKLVVPEGKLDTYSVQYPWFFFATMSDTKGQTLKYSAWEKFESGSGTYKYYAFLGGSSNNNINIRHKEGSDDDCQIVLKNTFKSIDLLIKYNKADNTCQVFPQATGYFDPDKEGIMSKVMVSDIPSVFEDETYEEYPCTYSPVTGQFRLNLAYYVGDELVSVGEDVFQMKGTFKDFSISISEMAGIVEKSDNTATQKITFSVANDVSKIKYVVLPDQLYSNDELRLLAQQIADGKIESKTKSKGIVNIVTVTYPSPGNYVVLAISVDADEKYYGNYTSQSVTFSSKTDWKEVAKGTYTYSLWFAKEDGSARKDKDKVLSQHVADPNRWKISNIFNGVDFQFTWIQETDSVYFEPQKIGEKYESYGDVYVVNNNGYFPVEETELYGVASYFDRASDTFKFNNVYCVTAGYFGEELMGVETFTVPGLATDISQILPKSTTNSQQPMFNLSGQLVGDSYKGIVIKNGNKYLKK